MKVERPLLNVPELTLRSPGEQMFLVAPDNILARGSEVGRSLPCCEFDQLSHKIFEAFQLDQWDNKTFLQDKDLPLDNSQYKIHIHREIILSDYYQQLDYAPPN